MTEPKQWIVDAEAAAVVKDIFGLCVAGNGPTQIARILQERKIPTPTVHAQSLGLATRNPMPTDPYHWVGDSVSYILEQPVYLGYTVNFKTHRQSYKIKKTVDNPKEQWKIFPNTHEPIVDEETFNRVQELRKNKRRPTRTGKTNMFSGIVRCADCKAKMYYCTTNNSRKGKTTSFVRRREAKEKMFVKHTSLEQSSWNRAFFTTFGRLCGLLPIMKKSLGLPSEQCRNPR